MRHVRRLNLPAIMRGAKVAKREPQSRASARATAKATSEGLQGRQMKSGMNPIPLLDHIGYGIIGDLTSKRSSEAVARLKDRDLTFKTVSSTQAELEWVSDCDIIVEEFTKVSGLILLFDNL